MARTKQEILDLINRHNDVINSAFSSKEKKSASKIAIMALEDDLNKFTDDHFGVRVHKNLDIKSLEIKASQGDAEAQSILGDLYSDHGKDIFDPQKASNWYLKAAEQGHTRAQWLVGVSYSQGIGAEKNEEKAEYWCLKSAQNGDVDGQYALGGIYFMKSDLIKAEFWIEKAANQGHMEAKEMLQPIKLMLGTSSHNLESIRSDPPGVGEWKWNKSTSDSLHKNISSKILYYKGQEHMKNRNLEKGVEHFEQAISLYNPATDEFAEKSLEILAFLHEVGMHPKADIEEAVKIYKFLMRNPNSLMPKFKLGLLYLEGLKVKHKPEEGLALVREVLLKLEEDSLINYYDYQRLGYIFYRGKHSTRRWDRESVAEAIKYLEKAVAGSREAGDQHSLESSRSDLENARMRLESMNSW